MKSSHLKRILVVNASIWQVTIAVTGNVCRERVIKFSHDIISTLCIHQKGHSPLSIPSQWELMQILGLCGPSRERIVDPDCEKPTKVWSFVGSCEEQKRQKVIKTEKLSFSCWTDECVCFFVPFRECLKNSSVYEIVCIMLVSNMTAYARGGVLFDWRHQASTWTPTATTVHW